MTSKYPLQKPSLTVPPGGLLSGAPTKSALRRALKRIAQDPLTIVLAVWALVFATAWVCFTYLDY